MLDAIRKDLEAFIGESEYGRLRGADPEALHARFPRAADLAGLATIGDALRVAEGKGDGEGVRRLKRLRSGVAAAWMRRQGREEEEDVEDALARSEGPLPDGSSVRMDLLRTMRETSPARDVRRGAAEGVAAAAAKADDARRSLARRRKDAAQELGCSGIPALWEWLSDLPLAPVVAGAKAFLAATRDAYRENFEWLLRRHDASLEDAGEHDLLFLRHEMKHVIPAPRDRMSRILEGAVKWFGVDPSAGGRLRRGAATAPPTLVARRKVPGEVHLHLYLEDGLPGWCDSLRALGRALSASYTSGTLPMEDRLLGDPAIPGAWGTLLSLAPLERDWIARVLDFGKSRDAAREFTTLRLAEARRLAGLVEAEVDFHAGSAPATLAERLSEATLAKHHGAPVAGEMTAVFDSAHRFREEAAGAALATAIETKYESWFRNAEAGPFLVDAWGVGGKPSLGDLLEKVGSGKDPFPLMPLYFTTRLA
jgi:hypothetical protein